MVQNKHIQPYRLGIVGASGRMGQRVLALAPEFPALALTALLTPDGHSDAVVQGGPNTLVTADVAQFAAAVDVVLDFSAPPAAAALAPACAAHGAALVVASTGLSAEHHQALDQAALATAVLQAANLSLGVQVLQALTQMAAAHLGAWDIEIVEAHHRHKADGPSGTALALGDAVQAGCGPRDAVMGWHQSPGPRAPHALGYSVIRGGDVAGEHTVLFLGEGERIELTHRSQSADIFARGGLLACQRLVGAAPGRYTMATLPPASASTTAP